MTKSKRALIMALAGVLALLSPAAAAPALAAAKPVITQLSVSSGPLRVTTITIRGRNLSGVKSVQFGTRAGAVARRSTSTTVIVRTPIKMKAGAVSVRVKTAAGWSATSKNVRYTFVAAPTLSKVSPASGTFAGGTTVTFTGKHFETTNRVAFGTQVATLVSRKAGSVTVKAPIGTLGRTKVVITTRGGTVAGYYTYVKPTAQSSLTLTAAAGTFVATKVSWVTGGHDLTTGEATPWQVGLPKGADLPTVDQHFLLKPGGTVFPSGLAGTVTEVAEQVDESVRVTVAPTDLQQALASYSLDYSGSVVSPDAGVTARAVEVGKAAEFALKGPTPLKCTDKDGGSVSVGVDLTTSVVDVDVDQHVDFGSLFRTPSFDGTVTAELQTTGKITVEAAATCEIKPEWANAHRKIIPLGTTGATVSFGPAFEFKISAKGTWSIVDRTRTTFAVHAKYGKKPTYTRDTRNVSHSQNGESSFGAELTAGASIQLGFLDRAGLQGKVEVGVEATIKASTAPNVCITGEVYGKLAIGVFFDAIVARWERDAFTLKISISVFNKCLRSEQPARTGEPDITSARLPSATIGAGYSVGLTVADGRDGSWSIVHYTPPAGLSLSADGTISGTPTGPVGDYPLIVDFKDADGRVATTTVRIQVLPGAPLGGGDVQATLRWSGAADLDLHVFDPSGEEIYYRNPASASGGQLDHDANANCDSVDASPVENVFWPAGKAPLGSYTVVVQVFASCDAPVDWHLNIRRNGVLVVNESGTGTSAPYSFTVGTRAAAARMSTPAINQKGSGK